jgi:C-terminal processing protease CtpA/Prc
MSTIACCALLAVLSVGVPSPAAAQSAYAAELYAEDFDVMWRQVADRYAYLSERKTDWEKVAAIYRPRAHAARSPAEFVGVLEGALEELYDAHAHLNTNTASSPRLVPSGADVWAEWRNARAVIVEVRPSSPASRAGLQPGMTVLSFNGMVIDEVVRARLGRSLREADRTAMNWALRAVLAGRRDQPRRLEVLDGGVRRVISLDDAARQETRGLLEHRRLGGDVGYIRIANSLGDFALAAAFDAALAELRDTKGLVLDLRDTPSGGNTTVARSIMGRFVDREMPYQKHSIPAEEREYGTKRSWLELVSPRGPFVYRAPVVVLVSHWTGSMGEGIAIGFDAMRRAKIVGTRMAGLEGATSTITLPHTRIGVTFPTERLFHVDGTPREAFVPPVLVDLTDPKHRGDDPILDAGLRALREALQER